MMFTKRSSCCWAPIKRRCLVNWLFVEDHCFRWVETVIIPLIFSKHILFATHLLKYAFWDKRHPIPTCHSWKTGLELWKWRPYKVKSLVSNSIYAKKDGNGPPSTNQVASKDKPRRGHAVCTLRVNPPTSPVPPFLLKDIAGSDTEVSWRIYPLWALKS